MQTIKTLIDFAEDIQLDKIKTNFEGFKETLVFYLKEIKQEITEEKQTRQTLKKFLQYIKDIEGTDYITIHDQRSESSVIFSEKEWKLLKEIAKSL